MAAAAKNMAKVIANTSAITTNNAFGSSLLSTADLLRNRTTSMNIKANIAKITMTKNTKGIEP